MVQARWRWMIVVGGVLVVNGAVLPVARVAGAQAAPPDPRDRLLAGLNQDDVAFVQAEHKPLFDLWWDVLGTRWRMVELGRVLGLRARPEAQRELARLQPRFQSAYRQYERSHERVHGPLADREQALKERAMGLDRRDPNRANARLQEQITQMYDEAAQIGQRLVTLRRMKSIIDDLARTMTDDYDLIGVPRHETDTRALLQTNPGMVQARLRILDAEADIKDLKEGKPDDPAAWGRADQQALQQIETARTQAETVLLREIERTARAPLGEIDRIERRIASLDDQIERARRSRRPTERLDERLSDLRSELRGHRSAVDALYKASGIPKPDGL